MRKIIELNASTAKWAGYRFALIVQKNADSAFVAGDPTLEEQRFVRDTDYTVVAEISNKSKSTATPSLTSEDK